MLTMQQADKTKTRLLLVKHSHMHNTRSFSKTHSLILAMERADKEKTGYTSGQTHIQEFLPEIKRMKTWLDCWLTKFILKSHFKLL